MTVVNPKSISGINSITMASGSDDLLTIHSNNTTERVRVNNSGDVIVGSGVTLSPDGDIFATGVTTSTTFSGNFSGGTVSGTTGTFTGDVDIADKIVHTGDTDTAIRFPDADTVTTETGGSERLRIASDGTIGVGNASPSTWGSGIPTIEFKGTSGSYTARAGAVAFESQSGSSGYNLLYSEGGNLLFYSGATNRASATERLRIASGGDVTVSTGNLVIGTSGKGIDFAATGDGSGTDTSELFDDYEEGTFNVTLPENGSGNQTVTNNPAGRYTKIGGFVYIYVYAIFSGSPQNNASGWQLGGLPYAPGTSGFTHHGMGQIQYTETYNYSVWRPLIASNSRIYFHRTDGSNNSLLNQDVVSIGMSYFLMGASYMSVN